MLLKENLVVVVLICVGWLKIVVEGGVLVDLMCGVGIFLVEVVLMVVDIVLNFRCECWGFSNWLGYVLVLWCKFYEEV